MYLLQSLMLLTLIVTSVAQNDMIDFQLNYGTIRMPGMRPFSQLRTPRATESYIFDFQSVDGIRENDIESISYTGSEISHGEIAHESKEIENSIIPRFNEQEHKFKNGVFEHNLAENLYLKPSSNDVQLATRPENFNENSSMTTPIVKLYRETQPDEHENILTPETRLKREDLPQLGVTIPALITQNMSLLSNTRFNTVKITPSIPVRRLFTLRSTRKWIAPTTSPRFRPVHSVTEAMGSTNIQRKENNSFSSINAPSLTTGPSLNFTTAVELLKNLSSSVLEGVVRVNASVNFENITAETEQQSLTSNHSMKIVEREIIEEKNQTSTTEQRATEAFTMKTTDADISSTHIFRNSTANNSISVESNSGFTLTILTSLNPNNISTHPNDLMPITFTNGIEETKKFVDNETNLIMQNTNSGTIPNEKIINSTATTTSTSFFNDSIENYTISVDSDINFTIPVIESNADPVISINETNVGPMIITNETKNFTESNDSTNPFAQSAESVTEGVTEITIHTKTAPSPISTQSNSNLEKPDSNFTIPVIASNADLTKLISINETTVGPIIITNETKNFTESIIFSSNDSINPLALSTESVTEGYMEITNDSISIPIFSNSAANNSISLEFDLNFTKTVPLPIFTNTTLSNSNPEKPDSNFTIPVAANTADSTELISINETTVGPMIITNETKNFIRDDSTNPLAVSLESVTEGVMEITNHTKSVSLPTFTLSYPNTEKLDSNFTIPTINLSPLIPRNVTFPLPTELISINNTTLMPNNTVGRLEVMDENVNTQSGTAESNNFTTEFNFGYDEEEIFDIAESNMSANDHAFLLVDTLVITSQKILVTSNETLEVIEKEDDFENSSSPNTTTSELTTNEFDTFNTSLDMEQEITNKSTNLKDVEGRGFTFSEYGYLIVTAGCIVPVLLATIVLSVLGSKKCWKKRSERGQDYVEDSQIIAPQRHYSA